MAILFTDFADCYAFNPAAFVNRKTADLGLTPASSYYCEQITPATGRATFNLRPTSDYVQPAVPESVAVSALVSGRVPRLRGDLLKRFTDTAGLTAVSGGLLSVATDYQFEGQPTLRFQSPSAGAVAGFSINTLSTRVRNSSLVLLVYIPDYTKVQTIQPYVSQGTTLTNYVTYSGYSLANDSHKYNGLHCIEVSQDMWAPTGTGVTYDGAPAQLLRVDVTPRAGQIADVRVIGAWLNSYHKPAVIFTFDDCRLSQYTNAFPLLSKYDIPVNAYVIPPLFGAAGHFTEDQAREIQAAGGSICNHAFHNGVGTNDSYSEIGFAAYLAQVLQCRDWLEARGFNGARHHAYVEGMYDQTLTDAMAANGMLTGRCISGNTTTGAQSMSAAFGVPRRLALKGGLQLSSARTLAEYKTEIDRAVRDGRDLIITAHDVFTAAEGGSGALSIVDTDFLALAAHVADYRAKGQCRTPNLPNWFAGLAAVPT
jgi:peptidoglycan/xylan/chitin deacetylase (PgdA/CDA1 family)